jgi:glucosamine--fructose-6-phosphate aminotransferase (isomerizing)
MCGIFGYVGQPVDAGDMVLDALRRLEYRGYDSWGVAVGVNGHIAVEKQTGKIGSSTVDFPLTTIGFGHTRWATHGGVTRANAHPHIDPSGRLGLIHNGILENFRVLKRELVDKGYTFHSETDTEVILHLITDELSGAESAADVRLAISRAFARMDGLNAIIVLDRLNGTLVSIKNVSPLVIGRSENAAYIASDSLVLEGKSSEVLYLDDGQLAQLSSAGVELFDSVSMEVLDPSWEELELRIGDSGLNGYPNFMLKEVHEQPAVIENVSSSLVEGARELAGEIERSYGTFLVGCGTASYAALTGNYLFSRIAKRHVNFVVGSEFGYQEHFLTDRSLVVALSQSGETADIIQSVLAAKKRGARIAALVNVKGSTLDRIADMRVYLEAGPEQCVLSTKAYTAKVALLLLTAHILNGTEDMGHELLHRATTGVQHALSETTMERVIDAAVRIQASQNMFVIGRGLSYPTALEAALKIKEVSYIHAEGFAGGELKHGVIALIEEGTPCLVFVPDDETRADILSGAMELKSRGGLIIGVSPEPDEVFDLHIPVLASGDASPLVDVVPAQMLGYHLALGRGLDPDKPRNLAKSVTVK